MKWNVHFSNKNEKCCFLSFFYPSQQLGGSLIISQALQIRGSDEGTIPYVRDGPSAMTKKLEMHVRSEKGKICCKLIRDHLLITLHSMSNYAP